MNRPSTARSRRAGTVGEWIVGGASLAVVLAAAAFLVYRGATRPVLGPAIEVRIDSIHPAGDSLWVVEFTAENTGGAPALEVVVRGSVGPADAPVETGQVTLDLVPEGARRRGGLQLRSDPRGRGLEVRATGWLRP